MAGLLTRSHRDRRVLVDDHHDQTMKRTIVEDHRHLLEMIISGDEDAADQALRQHFRIGDELRRQRALAPTRPRAKASDTSETLQ
jgi:DNA-binding FadR family transcriptional regulator